MRGLAGCRRGRGGGRHLCRARQLVRCRVQRTRAAAGSKSCCSSPADLPARGGSRCKKIAPAVAGASCAASSASLSSCAPRTAGLCRRFLAQNTKMRLLKRLKKLVETPSEEGSCVKVAGGAPMWLISRGFFIADKPVLGHKKSPRPPLKSCAAVLAVAKHFRSTAQDASDRAWPRVASVRAG